MTQIITAMIKEAIITTMALSWSSFQVGQETLFTNSFLVSSMYVLILLIFSFLHGRLDSNQGQRFWRPLFYH
jgi:hypothetical protein